MKWNGMNTTAERIATDLRRKILLGQLPPGTRLRQEAVAAELGVSRMPVRDALSKLQLEGLLRGHGDRGCIVSSLEAKDCKEIFDLRIELESRALRLAVPKHDDRTLRALKRLQEDLDEEDEVAGWIERDREFHASLYAPCDSPRLLGMVKSLRNEVERFALASMSPRSRRKEWSREHRAILAAVKAGDAAAATSHLKSHLRETEKVVLAYIAAQERSPSDGTA
jgi:DNA-binding GntR family transcriptional regulator